MRIGFVLIFVLLCIKMQTFAGVADTVKNSSLTDSLKVKKIVKPWKTGVFASLTFTNVKLSNWAAGGENSVSTMTVLNSYSNYKDSLTSWDNTFDAGFGMVKSGSLPFRKNDDKFELNSKFGRLAFKKLYYSTLVNFKSQFQDGFKYPNDSVPVSRFFAPAYLTVALGFDYRPKDFFSLYVSPATLKTIFMSDQTLADAGAYGVEPANYDDDANGNKVKVKNGKRYKDEVGAYLRARFQKELGLKKNINVLSTLNLFNNYNDRIINNRKNVDVNWETMVTLKFGKYLATSLYTNLIYDDNTKISNKDGTKSPKIQFKEVLGFGISYKISS
jgi:hypothetical protein